MYLPRSLAALLLMTVASLAQADPKAEVFAAWDAMVAAKAYRLNIETSANNQTFSQTVEVIMPERMRMTGGPGGDLVVTPEGAWIKLPGQDWTQAPPGTTALSKQFLSPEFVEQAKHGVTQVVALGTEQLAGKTVKTYQIESVLTIMGIESKSTTKLYVDSASGRPVRQEVDGQAMGRSSRTVQDLVYVPGLKIDAPK